MKYYILTIFLLSTYLSASAHTDKPITLNKEGKLIGLPKEYSDAEYDSTTFTLRINDKQIIVPECISMIYKEYTNYFLKFSASWNQDEWLLPYYLRMEIIIGDHQKGFEVVFNLKTLEIFQISDVEYIFDNNYPVPQTHQQEISQECHNNILNSIIKYK